MNQRFPNSENSYVASSLDHALSSRNYALNSRVT